MTGPQGQLISSYCISEKMCLWCRPPIVVRKFVPCCILESTSVEWFTLVPFHRHYTGICLYGYITIHPPQTFQFSSITESYHIPLALWNWKLCFSQHVTWPEWLMSDNILDIGPQNINLLGSGCRVTTCMSICAPNEMTALLIHSNKHSSTN